MADEYGEAIVTRRDDGAIIVERADDRILVAKELLAQTEPHWYRDGVLTLDTAGKYRFVRLGEHDQRTDVFERVKPSL